MRVKDNSQDRLALIFFWLIYSAIIGLLTLLGFNAIFQYYAPNGIAATLPLARLSEPFALVTAIELWDKSNLTQPFVAELNGLGRIDIQVVTWLERPRQNDVFWQLSEIGDDGKKILKRKGSFHARDAKDWRFVSLKFQPLPESACKHYEISFSAAGTSQPESIGLPIYKTQEAPLPEEMPRITSTVFKQTNLNQTVYSPGAISASLSYFYHKST
ncbi:hypothetical protein NC997_06430 [Trichocoleus sp. DQ-A2]|uniref:hypothetical protein n=1 Tax=Trichocoleus sp. DQ-A2 TaxID=2933924 RepID=UPI0019B17B52|nr:hypothetical protein [Coleofasciculus sp. FACHB-T130]